MNRIIVFLYITLMSIFSAQAQNDMCLPNQALQLKGFENIRVVADSNTVYAALEDPAYRGTFRGPAEALKSLRTCYPECGNYELVILEYGTPRVCVHAKFDCGKWDVNVDYNVERVCDRLKNGLAPTNKSYGKVDVNAIPIIKLVNNKYDKLYEVSVFFAPSIETTLWKGNRLTVQPIIPLYANLPKTDAHKNVHLGVASISQELFSNGSWTGKVAAGAFYPDVVGGYADLGYRVNSKLDLGVDVGYAYTSLFYDYKWYIGQPSVCFAMAKCSYYDPKTSFQFQAKAGRFEFGDWGARFDLTRHFGEYAIGLYGVLTGGEHNGGFHFSIPFGGKRQKRNGFIRVKLPEYYDMEYSMVSFWRYAFEKMGLQFEEIPDKNHSAHYWQAEYIEKYIQRYLDGTFE